jgi:hypothetical protein
LSALPIQAPKRGFSCEPAQNGGWLIREEVAHHMVPPVIGAFSNTDDMLTFLANWLREPEKDTSA